MKRNERFSIWFVLLLMACFSVSPAAAELLQIRSAKGNNVGLGVRTDWYNGGPFHAWPGDANIIQYPKGSGNLIYNDGWGFGLITTQDTDGDGTPEDTVIPQSGGRLVLPYICSIDSYDELSALATSGAVMEIAAAGTDGSLRSRVWTSLDADELAAWPTEAREGHKPGGAPVLHGAETMYCSSGDVFSGFGEPLSGFHLGYNLYFLDYGQSNNMVYSHLYMQNVSEYMKWNAVFGPQMWTKNGGPAPDGGWSWTSVILYQNWRQMGFGEIQNMGWAYHPAKGIQTLWCEIPQLGSWTPQEPPLLGMKPLKQMEHDGEVSQLLAVSTASGTEFGFSGAGNLMDQGWSSAKVYRSIMNVEGNFAGQTNPFTNRQAMDTWPGVLTPGDSRYNQWLWGGSDNWNHYTFWGELHDIAPRDTLSFDWVLMFSPSGVKPLMAPKFELANIDDPMMQTAFQPQEEYAAVAQTVFDGGYQTPATPAAPALTIVPGDREVTITWSDVNLKTPDPYYTFLHENGLDPNNLYREYDFEGYRLYRNFTGPNDAHAELLTDMSMSAGNLTFFYVDKLDDDYPLKRMRNGLKVWYALVPYDRNYDVSTGDMFSLPDPNAGKTWNRAGEAGLYDVIPRSDASNFRSAEQDGEIKFTPGMGQNPVFDSNDMVAVAGNGDGTLKEPPVYRGPVAEIEFTPVLNERLTTEKKLVLTAKVDNWKPTIHSYGFVYSNMTFELSEGGNVLGASQEFPYRCYTVRPGDASVSFAPTTSVGADYAVTADFRYLSDGNFRSELLNNFNTGGYTGATVDIYSTGPASNPERAPGFPPGNISMMRSGRFTLTWTSSGGGLSLAVHDVSRNVDLPFAEFPDDYGWGFVTLDNFGGVWSGMGQMYEDMLNDVPKAQRTKKMVSSLPVSNTAEFGLMVNGLFWRFSGTEGQLTGMPSAGTVMSIDNAYGYFNDDLSVFYQYHEPPFPGDRWEIDIKPMSLNAQDADLSKIKVVPNPYLASSYLDLSPTQRRIEFINLPNKCTLRIYSLGGNLVNVLNHIGSNRTGWGDYTDLDRMTQGVPKVLSGYDNHSGTEPWNLRNRFGQTVASGLYFFHVTDTRGKTFTGKFYIVN
ncbi:hypothetical protein LLH00_02575 [bacterium]|nr:hypothetical protein [bacterium]